MAAKTILTASRLREMLSYDAATGEFHWINGIQVRRGRGFPAGTVTRNDITIGIDGKTYRAHHLAWLYVTGKLPAWPAEEIDHLNTNPHDNRFINLRLATRAQNSQNQGVRSDNKSGFRGVSYCKRARKWQAHIRSTYLGVFDTKETAAAAYRAAALRLYGEFAHHSLQSPSGIATPAAVDVQFTPSEMHKPASNVCAVPVGGVIVKPPDTKYTPAGITAAAASVIGVP